MSRGRREWTNKTLTALEVFDPDPSTFTFDINSIPTNQLLSDWVVGVIHVAYKERAFDLKTLKAFSPAFTHDGHPRTRGLNRGQPFTDSNHLAVNCENVILRGFTQLETGGLSTDTIMASDPVFAAWFRSRGFDQKQSLKGEIPLQKQAKVFNLLTDSPFSPKKNEPDLPVADSSSSVVAVELRSKMADTSYVTYIHNIRANCRYALGLDMQVANDGKYAAKLIADLIALATEFQNPDSATTTPTKGLVLASKFQSSLPQSHSRHGSASRHSSGTQETLQSPNLFGSFGTPVTRRPSSSQTVDLTVAQPTTAHKRSSGGSFKAKAEDQVTESQLPDLRSAYAQGPSYQMPSQLFRPARPATQPALEYTPYHYEPAKGRKIVASFLHSDEEEEDEPELDDHGKDTREF